MKLARQLIATTAALVATSQLPSIGHAAVAPAGPAPSTAPLAPVGDLRVLVLDRSAQGALSLSANFLDATNGIVRVNSNDPCALLLNGTAGVLQARRIRVAGAACSSGTILGGLSEGVLPIRDPLRTLPEPDPVALGLPDRGGITGPGTYLPGYYPSGILVNGGTVHLEAGLYVIGSAAPASGIDLRGDAALSSNGGVTVFVQPNARITTSGSGSSIELAPPQSGTYVGVTIFMARTGNSGMAIGGAGVFDVEGCIYVPNGDFEVLGDVTRSVGKLIVNRFLMFGNSALLVTGV